MTNSEDNKKQDEEKKVLEIPENIIVKKLAEKMNIKATDLISELIKNKIFASINETIDFETAAIIADDFGFELVRTRSEIERRKQELKKSFGTGARKRPPIVVVMGHVDHGKTTLLDKVLQTNIVAEESGGITQHVSAYQVKKKGELITFLDTPGHEAFHAIRKRGAYITDIAVIVIAADDGVKPQTIEAINFAKETGVPILVVINKIDKSEINNVDKIKKQLFEIGLVPEEWGGKTVCINVSAKTGEGIDELLDMIILLSGMEEIKANPNSIAEGFVIESHLDPRVGPVATVLIRNGTLREGDYVSVGSTWGRIKRMQDFSGKKINKALPSTPVTITGLNETPMAGSFLLTEMGRLVAEKRALELSKIEKKDSASKIISVNKIKELVKSGRVKKMNLILKADTKGSLEAITQILESIETQELAIQILKSAVGNITETDIKMAISSEAKIIGFNIDIDSSAKGISQKENTDIKIFEIIYDLVDYIKKELTRLLEPEIVRVDMGKLKVIAIFKSGKKSARTANMIFGASVLKGKIEKSALVEIIRNKEKIGQGIVKELQYNKKEVKEVKKGNNAGITFEGNTTVEIGDILNAYKEEKKMREI